MFKRARNLIAAVALTLGVVQPASATVQIVPASDDVAGQSQLYWPRHGGSGLWASPNPTPVSLSTILCPPTIRSTT
jgi:hypothetical protein